jgi:hypothetical protein
VKNVIPTARGSFDATYTVADSGELRQARLTGAFYPKVATMTYTLTEGGELREAGLTGVFYPNPESMNYTIGFEDYGTEKKITAP